ncbi:hypothetical protein AB0M02_12965 [Actinoplanes sp. NPDC051861]|uniref:hypothetical protein n=1 Tax=Actinoplanes sp. NPDC051861 TaxID=3155170 RepID=UPI003442AE8E
MVGRKSLLAAGLAVVASLAGAAPGLAAPPPNQTPTMDFTAGPAGSEVRAGAAITLTGRIGPGRSGYAGRVDVHFEDETGRKVLLGTVRSTGAGHFKLATKAKTSGDYYATYRSDAKVRGKNRYTAYAVDGLAVFTTRTENRMVYTWGGTRLDCRATCGRTGPEHQLEPGPVRVTFTRTCDTPQARGRIGFTADRTGTYSAGDPGWRDFPDGTGPVTFDLNPAARRGHFSIAWTGPAACDLSFTADQRVTVKEYVRSSQI